MVNAMSRYVDEDAHLCKCNILLASIKECEYLSCCPVGTKRIENTNEKQV